MSNSMKIRPVGAEFYGGRIAQTDMKKLVVPFRTFAKTSKRGPKVFLFRVDLNSGSERNEIKYPLYCRVWQYELEGINV